MLATIHGEPSSTDYMKHREDKDNAKINNMNQEAWNNYFNTEYVNDEFIKEIDEKFAKRAQQGLPNPNK